MGTDTRKKLGKSCLVCRRRKVKCDKIKPVCLACIKHQSTGECKYEDRGNIRFFHMVYEQQHDSAGSGDKVSKTSGTKKQPVPKSNVVQELDFLKNKLHSLEVLLQESPPPTADQNTSPSVKVNGDSNSLAKFGVMGFNEDYGAIEVRAGRLAFAGPLHFIALSRRDPFLYVFITLLRKLRFQTHDEGMKNKSEAHRKYPYIKYSQDEIAYQLIYSSTAAAKGEGSSDGTQDNKSDKEDAPSNSKADGDKNSTGDAENAEDSEDADDSVNKSSSHFSTIGDNVELRFKKKLMENEGLDEMGSIDHRQDITNNPLSVVNLLNQENKMKSSLENETSSTPANQNGDLAIWRKLQTLLSTLQQQQLEQQKKLLANQRVPEMLFGQFASSSPSSEWTVLSIIQSIIPTDKLIWIHIDNFFKSPLYALYPVLNEDWFRDTMTNFIGERRDVEVQPKVTILKRFGFSNVGCLLIVLRLSFLMYPDKLENCSTDEERYVLSHPIGIEFINVAQMCLNLFKMLRKGVLPVLHCALLLRIYRRYAPEEGDVVDGGDTEPFTGLLVRIATSIGLNTEAETSYQLSQSPWYLQAWRKCWYIIYFLDEYEAMNSGNTTIIDGDSFNTKLPSIDVDANGEYPSYVTDAKVENASISCFTKNFNLSLYCRTLLKIVVNKRSKVSCQAVQKAIDEVEDCLRENFGDDLKTIISQPCTTIEESIHKCNNFKTYMETISFLIMVYFHLYLHVDKLVAEDSKTYDPKMSFFYLKKLLNIYAEVEPVLILLYYSKVTTAQKDVFEVIFGHNSKMIISQSCCLFISRYSVIMLGLVSRLEHLKFNYLNKEEKHNLFRHPEIIKSLPKMIDLIIKIALDKFANFASINQLLSGTYFYAWKLFKGRPYLYKLLNNQVNNLFDLNSKMNQQHVKLSGRDLETGEPLLQDALNPLYAIPKFNTLLFAELSDFGEILSILSSTKWDAFAPYIKEEEARVAREYRTNEFRKKRNGGKPKKSSISSRNSKKSPGLSEVRSRSQNFGPNDVSYSNSPQSTLSGSDVNSATVGTTDDIEGPNDRKTLDEVDAFWYSTMLRNANGNADWTPSPSNNFTSRHQNVELRGKPNSQLGIRTDNGGYEEQAENAEKIVNDEISNGNVGLDELFNNQALLQEHVIQQLQQLTSRQATINDQHAQKSIGNTYDVSRSDSPRDNPLNKDTNAVADADIGTFSSFDNFDLFFPISSVYGDDVDLK